MKIKKILTILSSVMIISASAVSPVCAEECNNLPKFEELELDLLVSVVKVGSETDLYLKELDENRDYVDYGPAVPGAEIRDGIEYIVDEEVYNDFMDACFGRNDKSVAEIEAEWFGRDNSYNNNNIVNHKLNSATVRDAAAIANALARGEAESLDASYADYNKDGVVNIRDAAAIAKDLAKRN